MSFTVSTDTDNTDRANKLTDGKCHKRKVVGLNSSITQQLNIVSFAKLANVQK